MPPWELPKCRSFCLPLLAQVVFAALGVTEVFCFCFCFLPPCPGGDCRPRSYQSVVVQRLPPLAQVVVAALGVTKVSSFIVSLSCPGGYCRPRGYHSFDRLALPAQVVIAAFACQGVVNYRLPPLAQAVIATLGVTSLSLFIVSVLLSRW